MYVKYLLETKYHPYLLSIPLFTTHFAFKLNLKFDMKTSSLLFLSTSLRLPRVDSFCRLPGFPFVSPGENSPLTPRALVMILLTLTTHAS